jgi:predicted membrane chloride channel (bestrophin family)
MDFAPSVADRRALSRRLNTKTYTSFTDAIPTRRSKRVKQASAAPVVLRQAIAQQPSEEKVSEFVQQFLQELKVNKKRKAKLVVKSK